MTSSAAQRTLFRLGDGGFGCAGGAGCSGDTGFSGGGAADSRGGAASSGGGAVGSGGAADSGGGAACSRRGGEGRVRPLPLGFLLLALLLEGLSLSLLAPSAAFFVASFTTFAAFFRSRSARASAAT